MIIAFGAPRTGLKSLAEALKILGYKGKFSCCLTGVKKDDGNDFLVTNDYDMIKRIKPRRKDVGIFVYRDAFDWYTSVDKYDYKGREQYEYFDLSEKYDLLLVYNVKYEWQKLCLFLNKSIPNQKFPNIK